MRSIQKTTHPTNPPKNYNAWMFALQVELDKVHGTKVKDRIKLNR